MKVLTQAAWVSVFNEIAKVKKEGTVEIEKEEIKEAEITGVPA